MIDFATPFSRLGHIGVSTRYVRGAADPAVATATHCISLVGQAWHSKTYSEYSQKPWGCHFQVASPGILLSHSVFGGVQRGAMWAKDGAVRI